MTPPLLPTLAAAPDMARLLGDAIPGAEKLPGYILWPVLMLVVAIIVVGVITVFDLFAVWLERKVSARIQCRLGPMEVGPIRVGGKTFAGGLLQTVADGVKLLAKEDIIPAAGDRPLYIIGPIIVFLGVFAVFVVLPYGPSLIPADLDVGLFYVAAVGSLEAIGVMMSGWASNNKWSLFGTMRTATQVVSYEIPLGLSFVTVIALAGTFSMTELCDRQAGWFFNWYVFANPFTFVAFVIYYIASLAQCKRAPFDLPEAESELVSGFHTEYSGMRFSIFFLSEYAAMYAVSAVAAVVFLGGYYFGIAPVDRIIAAGGPLGNVLGIAAMVGKSVFLVFVQMWLRWTLPRIRLDQVMHLCLKVLLPFAIACVIGAAAWQLFLGDRALLFVPRSIFGI
jgi:NADH-quinone oxidoreductase subunit H